MNLFGNYTSMGQMYSAYGIPQVSANDLYNQAQFNVPLDFAIQNSRFGNELAMEAAKNNLEVQTEAAKRGANLRAMMQPAEMARQANLQNLQSRGANTQAIISGLLSNSYTPRSWG